ncbi:kelch domain-containing protein 3-like isoform X2 [Gossypium australe]|uniref:Kelch domain-containing protein 3-like isoform X2 n=1 Tax=Gossypium australe TaxID=47621 RepID=A0A5B6UZJ3_9ROSI|nr:kelch domain-containing protein 3-like isoform X2 [Gossypium australe]
MDPPNTGTRVRNLYFENFIICLHELLQILSRVSKSPNPTFLSLQRLQLSFTFPLKIFIFPSKIIEEIKMRWEKVPLYQQEVGGIGEACSGPGKRWGHTCNSIKGGRFLYVFGGYGKDNCQTNQVHVFDNAKQTWSQPVMKGKPPSARDSHSCTTIGDNLFVFGGTDGTNTWICPSVRGEGPEEREGHGAAVVGKRLFIFGGCGKSSDNNDEVYYNNLYILNTETFVWKLAAISGNPPSARDSHTCSSWKNKIIVIGGEDAHDYYLSDVHIFDADTLAWKELNTLGQILPPRAGHSTFAFGKNLFVFGGFSDAQNLYDDLYMLDVFFWRLERVMADKTTLITKTGLWTKVITTGDGPSARFSVSGDCLDPLKSGVLIFIGGCNKTLEALDDMYYLYTGLVKDERKLEKLSLRKQLKLKCQQENLSNLVRDKAFVSIEADNDVHHQPISLFSCGQASKDSFMNLNYMPLFFNLYSLMGGVPGYASDEYFKKNEEPEQYGTVPSLYRYIVLILPSNSAGRDSFPSNEVLLQGKKIFHANVTESFPHGYTIETIIDGTHLRGILFSNKPNSIGVANYNLCRKRTSMESGDSVFGDCNSNSKSKSSRSMMQDYGDCKQGGSSCSDSRNPASYDLSIRKDLAKQESSVAHLNLTDDKANDAPNSGSEVLKGVGSVRTDFSVALSPRKMSKEQTPWSATNPKYHYKQ